MHSIITIEKNTNTWVRAARYITNINTSARCSSDALVSCRNSRKKTFTVVFDGCTKRKREVIKKKNNNNRKIIDENTRVYNTIIYSKRTGTDWTRLQSLRVLYTRHFYTFDIWFNVRKKKNEKSNSNKQDDT